MLYLSSLDLNKTRKPYGRSETARCRCSCPRWRPSWIWSNRKQRHSIRRPRKPYPGIKHEVDRLTRCGDMAIRNSTYYEGCIWDPHFEGRGVRRGSSIATLKRAMVVSYTLPLWPIALFLTIRLQFSVECLRRSIQRGSLGSKF